VEVFGMVHGRKVALLVDTSDACFGFGRRTQFIQDLTVNFSFFKFSYDVLYCEHIKIITFGRY